jgi:hypothetical protein
LISSRSRLLLGS